MRDLSAIPRWAKVIWMVWLALAMGLAAGPFVWHVEQFRNPGPAVYAAFLAAIPLLVIGSLVYSRARRRWLAWEPWIFLATPLILVAIHEPRTLLTITAVPAAALGFGLLLLRLARIGIRGGVAGLVPPLVLGLAAMMALLLPLGLAGMLWLWPVLLLPIVCLVKERRLVVEAWRVSTEAWITDESLRGTPAGLSIPWLFILEVLAVLTTLAPSRVWDVLRNHLVLAQHYAASWTLAPIPGLEYSYFPQGVELFMSVGLAISGQTGAQVICGLFFPVLMGLAWCIARECGASRGAALTGITIAAAIPSLHWTGSVAKNDAATAALLLGALYTYLLFRNTRDFRIVLVGAFMLSMAFHVKHVAIFGAVPIALLYLRAAWLTPKRVRSLALLALITLAVAPAYQIRAWKLMGNPFFPFSANTIASGTVKEYSTLTRPRTRLVRFPWTLHFDGRMAWEATSTSENPVGMFFVLFLPLGFMVRGGSRKWLPVLFFALLHYILWGMLLLIVRYFIAALAVLAMFYADRILNFWNRGGRLVQASVSFGLLFALLFGLCGTLLVEANAPFAAYFLKRIDRQQYLTEVVPDYGSLAFAVRAASPGDGIFGIGNCAGAYAGNTRFNCAPCNPPDGGAACGVTDLKPAIDGLRPRFIVIGNLPRLGPIREYVKNDLGAREVYRDRDFIVFNAGAPLR